MRIPCKDNENTLYEGRFQTIRRCVEAAVADRVDLSGADLRNANLRHARLDGAVMRDACLWGAKLSHADMAEADFSGSDFRAACLKETCLAESILNGCDFRGARLSGAIVSGAHFSGARFSCPSMFTVRWSEARTLKDAVYWHHGEIPCALDRAPLVIFGLGRDIVFLEDHVLHGGVLNRKAPGGKSGGSPGNAGFFIEN